MQKSKRVIQRIPNSVICLRYGMSDVKAKMKGILLSDFTGS